MSNTCPCTVRDTEGHRHDCAATIPDDRFICASCTEGVRDLLVSIPGWVTELTTQAARLNVTGPTVGTSGTKTPPLPVNVNAAEVMGDLRNTIRGIYLATKHHTDTTTTGMVDTLVHDLPSITSNPDAGNMADELDHAIHRARNAVDIPPDRIDVGVCGHDEQGVVCTDRVTAVKGEAWARCRTCGTEYDVADRRSTRVEEGRKKLVRASVICAVLTATGTPTRPDNITRWRDAGRIKAVTVDGVELYRLQEVEPVAREAHENRVNRKRRRTPRVA